MDLSPAAPPAARRRRSPWAYGALLVVLLALGVVVWKGLSSASLYFYNADEAVEEREDLDDKRFRLQGTVLGGRSFKPTDSGVDFIVAFNGAEVHVRHDGDPPELFEPGIPVVLEGRWAPSGDFFTSDRILVKHSEEYEAENEDRLDDAEDGATDGADAEVPTAP